MFVKWVLEDQDQFWKIVFCVNIQNYLEMLLL